MTDIFRVLVYYIPKYILDLGSLLASPKQFLAGQLGSARDDPDTVIGRAFAFLGVSIFLVVTAQAPLLAPGDNLLIRAGSTGIISLIVVSLWAVALRVAWWMVGGRAPTRSFLMVSSYFFGTLLVVISILSLIVEGFVKVFDPEVYSTLQEAAREGKSFWEHSSLLQNVDSPVLRIAAWTFALSYAALSLWGFIVWGAYRNLNGLGRWRSFLALIFMGPFAWVIYFVQSLLISATR